MEVVLVVFADQRVGDEEMWLGLFLGVVYGAQDLKTENSE